MRISDANFYYGAVYFAVQTSKIVEQDERRPGNYSNGAKRLSEIPPQILLAVREAIQDNAGLLSYAYSNKAYELFDAAKGK